MTAQPLETVALIPVRSLSGAKSRLGETLDAEERADLILAMLRKTVEQAIQASLVSRVLVVSADDGLLGEARALGATPVRQDGDGLNEALDYARSAAGREVGAVLVVPTDLPGVSAAALDRLVEAAAAAVSSEPDKAVVVLVPDQHGLGTNALLIAPPGAISFHFGERSRMDHADAATAAGASYVELDGPLAFDIDTPDDLLEADRLGLGHEAGR
jgi:2-phospho-L-lactate guanylyltransferase